MKGSPDSSGRLTLLARAGYGAKAFIYLIMGMLALQGVVRGGPEGALSQVAAQPFGKAMLALLAIGLAAYALWRLAESTLDPEQIGRDAKAVGQRIGYFCSGLVYGTLALSAARLVIGGGGGGGDGTKSGVAQVLSIPFGQWLVGVIAVGILFAGLHQGKHTVTRQFLVQFEQSDMSATQLRLAAVVGSVGHAVRAVLYIMVGGFLLISAWQEDSDEAGGLGDALDTLQEQPYGNGLLFVAGVGLVCYSLYCLLMARYRRHV